MLKHREKNACNQFIQCNILHMASPLFGHLWKCKNEIAQKKIRITSLYRFSFLWVFQSPECWFFAANDIMFFTEWNIRGFVHEPCICLKTRKSDSISQWNGWECGQHRIGCLMQKSKPLASPPFSSPIWEPHLFGKNKTEMLKHTLCWIKNKIWKSDQFYCSEQLRDWNT